MNRSLIFTRNVKSYMDKPIRAFEGSDVGHVACKIGGLIIDSAFLQKGVCAHKDYSKWLDDKIIVQEIPLEFDPKLEQVADAWLHAQVGKSYDWKALVGFMLWRNFQKENTWYCSELAMAWCIKGGWTLAASHSRIGVRLVREISHARRTKSKTE